MPPTGTPSAPTVSRAGRTAGAAGEPRPPERSLDHAQAGHVLKSSLQVAQLLLTGKSEKHRGFEERPWVSPLTWDLSHSPSIAAAMPPGPPRWRSAGHCTARLWNQDGEGRADRPRKASSVMAPEVLSGSHGSGSEQLGPFRLKASLRNRGISLKQLLSILPARG